MNPRNPYKHEISFDQHVWLPTANENYRHIGDMIEDRDLIERLIESTLKVVPGKIDHSPLVTEKLLSELSISDLSKVREKLKAVGTPEVVYSLVTAASHFFPEMQRKMGTSIVNPPEHIHRMQRGDWYIGDLYSADMITATLAINDFVFKLKESYLDFGCSSGSLIRVLKAYAPDSTFHGVDPIPSSVEWARENIPDAHFSISSVLPPLTYEKETFAGATAVSIWSHLGEKEGLAWFDEMHRVLKPGGWLFFTTHGETSISYYNKQRVYHPRRVLALLEGLVNSDFVFEEVYLGESPEGLSATGYGNAYFRTSWVDRNLSRKWDVVYFGKGENQANQDIYLLRKR